MLSRPAHSDHGVEELLQVHLAIEEHTALCNTILCDVGPKSRYMSEEDDKLMELDPLPAVNINCSGARRRLNS